MENEIQYIRSSDIQSSYYRKAYAIGEAAAKAGRLRPDNPYLPGTVSAADWDAGWLSSAQPV